MTALTERLREALAEHQYALACIRQGHIPNGGYPQHLADVAAQVVAEWLAEQREPVGEAVEDAISDPHSGRLDIANAVLAALRAAAGKVEG